MAEKYGVVPKKFTKEWWPYFWMYYKTHTLAVVFVIICIVYGVYQYQTTPRYDLTATYTGATTILPNDEAKITEFLTLNTQDIDKNGESSPFFQQLVVDPKGDPEYNYAMQTRLTAEFTNECSYIFLFDNQGIENVLKNKTFEGAFLPVNEWLTSETDAEKLVYTGDSAYCVSLEGSSFKNELISFNDGLYVALCTLRKDDEKNIAAFKNSKAILNAILQ